MNKYKIILFDLDGTLSDPKEGITRSVQYALEKLGVVEPDLDRLEPFIGPPLQESFSAVYAFDDEKTKLAIDYYRERFKETGMFENELYPGIEPLLAQLKAEGKRLAVATSKPTVFAERILQYFRINSYFDFVVGSHLDGTRISKTEIIQYILDELSSYKKQDFIMIGDRKHDIIGAKNTGIDSIGVAYGYGSFDELHKANPTFIVHEVEQLGSILR